MPIFAVSFILWRLQNKWGKGCHATVQHMHQGLCLHQSCWSTQFWLFLLTEVKPLVSSLCSLCTNTVDPPARNLRLPAQSEQTNFLSTFLHVYYPYRCLACIFQWVLPPNIWTYLLYLGFFSVQNVLLTGHQYNTSSVQCALQNNTMGFFDTSRYWTYVLADKVRFSATLCQTFWEIP